MGASESQEVVMTYFGFWGQPLASFCFTGFEMLSSRYEAWLLFVSQISKTTVVKLVGTKLSFFLLHRFRNVVKLVGTKQLLFVPHVSKTNVVKYVSRSV